MTLQKYEIYEEEVDYYKRIYIDESIPNQRVSEHGIWYKYEEVQNLLAELNAIVRSNQSSEIALQEIDIMLQKNMK